jgi:hypothetical protein
MKLDCQYLHCQYLYLWTVITSTYVLSVPLLMDCQYFYLRTVSTSTVSIYTVSTSTVSTSTYALSVPILSVPILSVSILSVPLLLVHLLPVPLVSVPLLSVPLLMPNLYIILRRWSISPAKLTQSTFLWLKIYKNGGFLHIFWIAGPYGSEMSDSRLNHFTLEKIPFDTHWLGSFYMTQEARSSLDVWPQTVLPFLSELDFGYSFGQWISQSSLDRRSRSHRTYNKHVGCSNKPFFVLLQRNKIKNCNKEQNDVMKIQ